METIDLIDCLNYLWFKFIKRNHLSLKSSKTKHAQKMSIKHVGIVLEPQKGKQITGSIRKVLVKLKFVTMQVQKKSKNIE